MLNAIRNFVRNEEGATTAEYGIIVVIMAAIAFAVLSNLDTSLGNLYQGADSKINAGVNFNSAN